MRSADALSRVSDFAIIDSTLREGEQFIHAHFDTDTKVAIARALDALGVEYIEVTSPAASEQSRRDCALLAGLGLRAKVVAHVRCHMDDVRIAADTGVAGLNVVIGTSPLLREHSHGKDMAAIAHQAEQVITYVRGRGLEVRFSSEDAFRSDLVDLLALYRHVDRLGVDRVGVADTVGCADPRQVYDVVRTLRGVVGCDIETHFHNDTGCAVANAYCALQAGATHIDTCVLGIGERNGITPLGALLARVYTADRDAVMARYDLRALLPLEQLVARAVGIEIPFNECVTGANAFSHKAGIHAKAVLKNPSTYEVLRPDDFGVARTVAIGHRLTGWNAVRARAVALGVALDDAACKALTARIKERADEIGAAIDTETVDAMICSAGKDASASARCDSASHLPSPHVGASDARSHDAGPAAV
ncbi:mitochondrial homocitrate synthase [Blastocladiella britannica]|nr:mitochondrial homocitrate synthase [Blastocladiella britannica]